jgi:succinoglycan biosynthesis transport protein ExoP
MPMNNNNRNRNINPEIPQKEKTLLEIFQLILKNKYILFSSVLIFIVIAIVYSFVASPKYEATVTLKKENNPDEKSIGSQDISAMLNLQSADIIETEMQLVSTYSVISKVVDKLDLFCTINELQWGDKNSYDIDKSYLEMSDPVYIKKNSNKFSIPNKFELVYEDTSHLGGESFIIKKTSANDYILLDATDQKLISKSEPADSLSISDSTKLGPKNIHQYKIKTDFFIILVDWEKAPLNSELLFSLRDFGKTILGVMNSTKVKREGKTDIFYVTYSSSSATAAAIIDNTIVETYRESRLAQKKENIRYSYQFVDKQLSEVQDKLKQSESELSNYKASGQIMSIDASSKELMGFLSNLEAEKYNTDLQLADYKNRAADLEKELKKNGFFDQSYLNPQGQVDAGNSPFSQLMRQLSDLELQRLELLQKRTENHPDVIAIDEQIKLTKSKLASFNENTITAYKIMINTLEKKLLKINDLMSKYEVKMRTLPSQENRLAQLTRQSSTYEKIFSILLDQREAMRVAELSKMQDVTVIDDAKAPEYPSWPNKKLIVLISLVLGGFIGILMIFSLELYRTKFVNLDELETEFQVPILSIIPKYSKEILNNLKKSTLEYKIASLNSSDNGIVETYRLFRTKLFQKLTPENKILLITSCEENTGKTSVTANLAVSLSQEGKKVLLVDCDLRKGDLSKMFGLSLDKPGLLNYLNEDTNPKIYSRASKLIDILPVGGLTKDSGTILSLPKMKSLLDNLSHSNYDLILVDSPPVTRVVDPLVLAQFIKDAIIIVRPNYSLIETVRWGMQELSQANIRIKGIVANAATIENSYYYRYRYGYGYGYSPKKEQKSASTKRMKKVT